MQKALRYLAGFLLVIFSFQVFAQEYCEEFRPSDTGKYGSAWFKTHLLACQHMVSILKSTETDFIWILDSSYSTSCQITFTEKANGTVRETIRYLQNREVLCEPACPPVGTLTIVNATVGWGATASDKYDEVEFTNSAERNKATDFGKGIIPVCLNKCLYKGTSNPSKIDYWISQVASPTGLYRHSLDFEASSEGKSCEGSLTNDAAVDPNTPPPPCAGQAGTVNGVPVCLARTSRNNGIGSLVTNEPSRGNPSAGPVAPAASPAERANGGPGNSNTDGSSPRGGPATGSAIGTGIANNTGCNDGSKTDQPSCQGRGIRDSDGTTTKPPDGKEQAECGAPGQPKCGIDETGTPTGVDNKFDSKADDYKTKMDEVRAKTQNANGQQPFSTWSSFFSAPPVAACSPIVLPADRGSLDPCPVVDGTRTVVGFAWAIGAFWLCLGWIREV